MKEKIVQGKPGADKRWAFMEGFDIGTEGDPKPYTLVFVAT